MRVILFSGMIHILFEMDDGFTWVYKQNENHNRHINRNNISYISVVLTYSPGGTSHPINPKESNSYR